MIQFLHDNGMVILGALLAVSESLALIPALKSNSILQLVINLLKGVIKPEKV